MNAAQTERTAEQPELVQRGEEQRDKYETTPGNGETFEWKLI